MIDFAPSPYFWPLLTFAFAASATPGPNVVLVTASGANFGYWRTLPHIMGIATGFPILIVALGLGLGELFKLFPVLHTALRVAGSAYLVFLAWKIATAGRAGKGADVGRPMTYAQAFGFQWVNPKAWMMGISALTAFTTGSGALNETLFVALIFSSMTLPVASFWCLFGTGVGRLLATPKALRTFNFAMALLIVGSIGLLFV